MDVNRVLQQVDQYYESGQGAEAEKLMRSAIAGAAEEKDDESLLQLLNELLGYYRETGQAEASFAVAEQSIALAEKMGLSGTIPYATTLLNVANAYRAGGRLEDSLDLYLKVRKIYREQLPPDSMMAAGLENNMSLLYQEMGKFAESRECLLKALHIAEGKEGAGFEAAVTRANLAGSCLQLGEREAARGYAEQSAREFEAMGVEDSHYGAALSALASCYFQEKDYAAALEIFERAQGIIERNLGQNEYYRRLESNVKACREALQTEAVIAENAATGKEAPGGKLSGMELCRAFYETYGRPMIAEKFPDYESRIAVGMVGRGSDCFGYDDMQSRDHDWGPDFCLWVTNETFAAIGEELKRAYQELPKEFMGFKRLPDMQDRRRRGVFTVTGFFGGLLGAEGYEHVDWRQTPDYALAAVVNGEVFRDDEEIFTMEREKFRRGYPETVRFLKMADSAARFSQTGQYNYRRMLERGDAVTAGIMLADCMREAMKLQHYIEGRYPPHDKWLCRSLSESDEGRELAELLERMQSAEGEARVSECVEETAVFLVRELYRFSYISDSDPYLDAHSGELARKASFAACTDERLVEWIAEAEFEAFDKVRNAGGRASCQNDWATFSIMRKSQYSTWNRVMLMQYLYDFIEEYERGHNLIEEKYGRMMESTAPEEYERIKGHFPTITPEKKAIIEQIIKMQVEWMEEFAAHYPALAENARNVHTSDDAIDDTSYETYLRGEISTYSDKMLELYGRYVVEYAQSGRNPVYAIVENSVRLYGYEGLDAAEKKTMIFGQKDAENGLGV